jgi:hypothetical protein
MLHILGSPYLDKLQFLGININSGMCLQSLCGGGELGHTGGGTPSLRNLFMLVHKPYYMVQGIYHKPLSHWIS